MKKLPLCSVKTVCYESLKLSLPNPCKRRGFGNTEISQFLNQKKPINDLELMPYLGSFVSCYDNVVTCY